MSNLSSYYLTREDKKEVSALRTNNSFKSLIALTLSLVFAVMFLFSQYSQASQKAEAFDATKYIMCEIWGESSTPAQIYQASQSSDVQFNTRSKSTINSGISDVGQGLNKVIEFTGGKDFQETNDIILGKNENDSSKESGSNPDESSDVSEEEKQKEQTFNGGEKVSPYDRFGVAGLKFTSYTGEWRHLIVDACAEEVTVQDPKAGDYYEGRLSPLSTWEDISKSNDIRTAQFNRGANLQLSSSVATTSANMLFQLTKTIVTFAIGLINLSFNDLGEVLGINDILYGDDGEDYGSDDGVFATVYNNLFVPLLFIMMGIVGAYVLIKGARRQYRDGISTIFRSLLMIFIAALIAAMPATFMSMPNNLAVWIQTGALTIFDRGISTSGDLCETNVGAQEEIQLVDPDAEDDRERISSVGENMSSVLGCTFWETFLVKPWSEGQFNADWNALWANELQPEWADEKTVGNLGNKNESWVGNPEVPMGGGQVLNNWALFQMSVQTNVHSPVGDPGGEPKVTSGISNDWWRIVDAVSNYTETGVREDVGDGGGESSGSTPEGEWVKPADAEIISGFGPRSGIGDNHLGIDLPDQCGEPVYAASGGDVEYVGRDAFGANLVLISHSGSDVDTLYVHMEDNSIIVKEGDRVKAGDKIATIGNTGKSFGCHLHFEVREPSTGEWAAFGSTIDPEAYLKKAGVDLEGESAAEGGNPEGSEDSVNGVPIAAPDTPAPTSSWWAWVGNTQWSRLGVSFTSIIVAGIGLAGPIVFAFLSSVYAIVLQLIMMFAPVMLLFAVGESRSWNIFKGWVDLIIKYTIYRILLGIMLVISLIFTLMALERVETVGWWQGMLLLVLLSLFLFVARKRILSIFDNLRISTVDFTQNVKKMGSQATGITSTSAKLATSGISGGFSKKVAGGSFRSGATRGFKNELRNNFYKSNTGRKMLNAYDKEKKEFSDEERLYCESCSAMITKNMQMAIDSDGFVHCMDCYDEGNNVSHDAELDFFDPKRHGNSDSGSRKKSKPEGKEIIYSTPIAESKKNRTKQSEIKSGKHSDEDNEKMTQDLMSTLRYDIRNSLEHSFSEDGDMKIKSITIPKELEKYLDKKIVQDAWKDKNFEYLQAAYTYAWATWYQDTTGKKMDTSIDDLLYDVQEKTNQTIGDLNNRGSSQKSQSNSEDTQETPVQSSENRKEQRIPDKTRENGNKKRRKINPNQGRENNRFPDRTKGNEKDRIDPNENKYPNEKREDSDTEEIPVQKEEE